MLAHSWRAALDAGKGRVIHGADPIGPDGDGLRPEDTHGLGFILGRFGNQEDGAPSSWRLCRFGFRPGCLYDLGHRVAGQLGCTVVTALDPALLAVGRSRILWKRHRRLPFLNRTVPATSFRFKDQSATAHATSCPVAQLTAIADPQAPSIFFARYQTAHVGHEQGQRFCEVPSLTAQRWHATGNVCCICLHYPLSRPMTFFPGLKVSLVSPAEMVPPLALVQFVPLAESRLVARASSCHSVTSIVMVAGSGLCCVHHPFSVHASQLKIMSSGSHSYDASVAS